MRWADHSRRASRTGTTLQAPSPVPAVPRLPIVVVGAGIGGACAALALSRFYPVVVIEERAPASGASGAAAGLVNPFAGRRGTRAWQAAEARAALDRLAAAAGVALEPTGVLRPARDGTQARAFRRSAEAFPDEAAFLDRPSAAGRWPGVDAPHGALWVPGGGHVDVPRLVRGTLAEAERLGATVRTGVRLTGWRLFDHPVAITDQGDIPARALVLCPGAEAPVDQLAYLPFGRVKGQTVRLEARLPAGFPAVAGGTYVVPTRDGVVVGSTFEHTYDSLAPDPHASGRLRDAAARLVPALAGARVFDARAGVRLTVPTTLSPERLPRLGAVDDGVILFAGFGSRGLLTAPLLAETLPGIVADPRRAPPALRPVSAPASRLSFPLPNPPS